MSGDIVVSSTVEEGSEFTAKILVREGDLANRVGTDAEVDESIAIEGMRVLVAEDNPINRKVIEKLLIKLSVDVSVVDDGQRLLDQVDDINPELILMDCHMPILDGFETTRELRRRGLNIPIYALTAGVSSEERAECTSIGMNEILTKPVTLQSLKFFLQKAKT